MIIENMDKPLACLEISTEAVKLLIGYELSGQPVVLYTKSVPCHCVSADGSIQDKEALKKALDQFHKIEDENAKVRVDVQEVCIVLPSTGLNVYTNRKASTVVSPEYRVGKIDVNNVISQIKKEVPPPGNEIVDIIPDLFFLDSGKPTLDAPIGEKGSQLAIQAKVFVLPNAIANGYKVALEENEFRVKSRAVAAYCYAELFKSYKDLPTSYLLVDIGANITTVSLIGRASPYGAMSFARGSSSLTKKIEENFHISKEEAEKLKCSRGYDERRISYNPPICQGYDENGIKKNFLQQDLNQVIMDWLEDYAPLLNQAIAGALKSMRDGQNQIPMILTGGGSRLFGLKKLLANHLKGRDMKVVTPRSIGARDPSFGALLGLVMSRAHYRGSLEESKTGVVSVEREAPQKERKPAKRKRGSLEEDDVL